MKFVEVYMESNHTDSSPIRALPCFANLPIIIFLLKHFRTLLRKRSLVLVLMLGATTVAGSGPAFGFDSRYLKGVDAVLTPEARHLSPAYGFILSWLKNARWNGAFQADVKDSTKLDSPLDDSSALIQFLFPAHDGVSFVPNQYPGEIKSLKPGTLGMLLQEIFQLKPEQIEKLKNDDQARKALHQRWLERIFLAQNQEEKGKSKDEDQKSTRENGVEAKIHEPRGVVNTICETETQGPSVSPKDLEKLRKNLLLPKSKRPHEKDFIEILIGALIETKAKVRKYQLPHLVEHSLLAFFAAKGQGKEDLLELWRGMPALLDRTQGEPHWILNPKTTDPTAIEKREKFLKEEFNSDDYLRWENRFQQLESNDGKEHKKDSRSDSNRVFESQSLAQLTEEFLSSPVEAVVLKGQQVERPRSIAYSTSHYKTMPYADCGETSIRNFLNYVVFNPHSSSRVFDTKFLPLGVKPDSKLFRFYQANPDPKDRTKATVYDAWSEVISNLDRVTYLKTVGKTNSSPGEGYEIKDGVKNTLTVLEQLLADPELSSRKSNKQKWNRICDLLSRDESFLLDWSVKDGKKEDVDKYDTGIELQFSVSGYPAFSWRFPTGHAVVSDAPSSSAENWIKKIQSQLKTQGIQTLSTPLLALIGEGFDSLDFVSKLPEKDRASAKEFLLLGRPLVSENDYFSFAQFIFKDQMQSYYPHALRILQKIPADDLNGQCKIQELLLSFPKSIEIPAPFQELGNISEQKIRSQPNQAAKIAIESGWTRLLERLFEPDFELSASNDLLPLAADYGRTGMTKLLLDHWANIDEGDNRDDTALHLAAHNGHTDTLELLLNRKADVDKQNYGSETPLHLAITNHHIQAVRLLLDHKAKIDVKDDSGRTPLHLAARTNCIEAVRLLLDHKAKINVRDKDNSTPWNLAANDGHFGVVELLNGIDEKNKGDSENDEGDDEDYDNVLEQPSQYRDPAGLD